MALAAVRKFGFAVSRKDAIVVRENFVHAGS